MKNTDIQIEFPSMGKTYVRNVGKTYVRNVYGVYQYGRYPRSSVLGGQVRRQFLDSFETLDEARAAYPDAIEEIFGAPVSEEIL